MMYDFLVFGIIQNCIMCFIFIGLLGYDFYSVFLTFFLPPDLVDFLMYKRGSRGAARAAKSLRWSV